MVRSRVALLASALLLPMLAAPQGGTPPAPAPAAQPVAGGPPRAEPRPVVDTYHGVEVADPYRWLEDPKAPEVAAWTEAQAAHARAAFDALPNAAPIREQVRAIITSFSEAFSGLEARPTGLFALRRDPALQQPQLVLLPDAGSPARARILLDPNVLDPSGKTAIDFYVPSLDGRRVAVSLSAGGTEAGDVHLYDVATGKPLGEVIPRVNGGTAGGSVAWSGDGKGLWYTRYPASGERPAVDLAFFQEVWFHRLGEPIASDRRDLEAPLGRIAEVELATKRDGRWVVAQVKNGDGGEMAWWLRPAGKGAWIRIADLADKVVGASFGEGDTLYLLSRKGAPRGRVLSIPLPPPAAPLEKARTVVQEGPNSIEGLLATRTRLYLRELDGGLARLRFTGLDGRGGGAVPIPAVATVSELVRLGGDDLLFDVTTYVAPFAWFRWSAADGKVHPTALKLRSPVDLSAVEASRGFATSKDGTRVPVDVLRLKGAPRQAAPAILYAYGGYGVSQTPAYSANRGLWLLNGGVYAIAAVRGGGEYGEAWHLAGNLTHKQHTFDDLIAAAEWLVAQGLTAPDRLGILGGSNGGLTVGAAMTQRPDLFRAVVDLVGIADMLRVEATPNGAFNVTEFGTVKDEAQFKALHAYSPYHAIRDGTAYPAVVLTAGENDPRVDAWHAKKMAARLQAATSSGRPVLLRMSSGGHGIGSSRDERIAETGDVYAFLTRELGLSWRPIPVSSAPAR